MRVEIIQVWRFIAALGVVITHSHARTQHDFPGGSVLEFGMLADLGAAGVDLFFVISGFIMAWTNWDRFGNGGYDFWARRIARIVPLYWFATTLLLAAGLVPGLFNTPPPSDTPWILASYLLIPWPSPTDGVAPLLSVGWTLVYEAYFYFVFGLALFFTRRVGIILVCAYFAATVVIGALARPEAHILYQYTSWLVIEFCLGVLIAYLVKNRVRPSREAVWMLCAIAVCALAFTGITRPEPYQALKLERFVLWGIPAALLIFCSLQVRHDWIKGKAGACLTRLGDSTYSIYVLHLLALPVLVIAIRMAGIDQIGLPADVMTALLAIGSVAAGVAGYYVIERPITRTAQRLLVWKPLRTAES